MAKVKIIFHKQDGKITSEVNGVKGKSCTEVTKFLDQLGEVKSQQTAEYFEDAQDNDVMINTQNS